MSEIEYLKPEDRDYEKRDHARVIKTEFTGKKDVNLFDKIFVLPKKEEPDLTLPIMASVMWDILKCDGLNAEQKCNEIAQLLVHNGLYYKK